MSHDTFELPHAPLVRLGARSYRYHRTSFLALRASLTWPTAEGAITSLNVERKRGTSTPGGHYFCATFTNPAFNDLELDSWTYTNDRPTFLDI